MRCGIILLCICMFTCIINLAAQEIRIQPYAGFSADYTVINGSFDGKSIFRTATEIIMVPELKPAGGFGVLFGVQIGNGAIDFAYHHSKMEYTSLEYGFSGKSSTNLIRFLGFKKYFKSFSENRIKPYLDFDLSVAFLNFEKITYMLNSITDSRSANYGGIIVGAGMGTTINMIKGLALDLKVLPELYVGTDIKSKDSKRYEIKNFNNFLLINSIGINYYFKVK